MAASLCEDRWIFRQQRKTRAPNLVWFSLNFKQFEACYWRAAETDKRAAEFV
jgi:hypothetical protein